MKKFHLCLAFVILLSSYACATLGPNLISNSSAEIVGEDLKPVGWGTWASHPIDFTTDDQTAYSRNRSFKMGLDSGTGRGIYSITIERPKPGSKIKAGMYYKIAGMTKNIGCRMELEIAVGGVKSKYGTVQLNEDQEDWGEISTEWVEVPDGAQQIVFQVNFYATDGYLWFDDVWVTVEGQEELNVSAGILKPIDGDKAAMFARLINSYYIGAEEYSNPIIGKPCGQIGSEGVKAVLDLGSPGLIDKIKFKNPDFAVSLSPKECTIWVASDENSPEFNPNSVSNFDTKVFEGAIMPSVSDKGTIRSADFDLLRKRYFLIVFTRNFRAVDNIIGGINGYISTVWFDDIIVDKMGMDLGNSTIRLSNPDEPVSADGISTHLVEVLIKDANNAPLANREVTLSVNSDQPGVISIINPEIETNEEGKALFKVKAKESDLSVEGTLVAKIIDIDESEVYLLEQPTIKFVGKLLIGDDKTNVSISRVLVPGLDESDLPLDTVPADGFCGWKVSVKLVGTPESIKKRTVQITEIGSSFLSPNDIQPASEIKTNDSGIANFFISSTSTEIDQISIEISVLNDAYATWTEELDFTTEDLGLYVIDIIPRKNEDNAEINNPLVITFNKPLDLVVDSTKMTLIPQQNGVAQPITSIYDGTFGIWSFQDNVLNWHYWPLVPNVWYTATLEGVIGTDGSEMLKSFSWLFKGVDRTPPEIVKTESGELDVEPRPWQAEIDPDSEINVKIRFTEGLLTGQDGLPVGLKIKIEGPGSQDISLGQLTYIPPNTQEGILVSEVNFVLIDLTENATYCISVSGAQDFADFTMQPTSWCFSTTTTDGPKVVKVETNENKHKEPLIDTPIRIYFNKYLDSSQMPIINVKEKESQMDLFGDISFINTGLGAIGLILNLNGIFDYDTIYEVIIQNVMDLEGKELLEYSFEILTEVQSSEMQTVSGNELPFLFEVPQPDGDAVPIEVKVPFSIDNIQMEIRNTPRSYHRTEYVNYIYHPQYTLTPYIFELCGYQNEKNFDEKFVLPMKVTIPYVDIDNKGDGTGRVIDITEGLVLEKSLRAFRLDNNSEWVLIESDLDVVNNTITFEADYFGKYALIGVTLPESFLSGVTLTNNPIILGGNGSRNETAFKFFLSRDSKVTLEIYNASGRLIGKLMNETLLPAGVNAYFWDGKIDGIGLKPGIYLYRLFATSVESANPANGWSSGVLGIAWP